MSTTATRRAYLLLGGRALTLALVYSTGCAHRPSKPGSPRSTAKDYRKSYRITRIVFGPIVGVEDSEARSRLGMLIHQTPKTILIGGKSFQIISAVQVEIAKLLEEYRTRPEQLGVEDSRLTVLETVCENTEETFLLGEKVLIFCGDGVFYIAEITS